MGATRKRTAFTSAARSPITPSPALMLVSLCYHLGRATIFAALEAMRIYLLPSWLRGPPTPTTGCVFYEGTVMHSRLAPEKHSFSYSVRYCLVDVCEPPVSPYVASLLAAGGRMSVEEVRRMSGCRDGRIRALLMPESARYEQNPIVVYYCYDMAGELRCCIAEVTNTPWGDRVAFPFAPAGDLTPKALHVSPLQDMLSSWRLSASPPAKTLRVQVDVRAHPTLGDFFVAILDAEALPAESVEDPERWAFFVPHQVAIWIYWHAVLLLRKGLSLYGHPKSAPGPDYRLKPLARAEQAGWQACPVLAARFEPSKGRPYVWQDAGDAPWT